MSNVFVPIQTADIEWRHGAPFNKTYTDVYHSLDGALEQSYYVFVEGNDLISRWHNLPQKESSVFHIGETGFGTALNFLLTWSLWVEHAPERACLHFISCEKHPLTRDDLARVLSLWPQLMEQATQLLENYPVLTPGFHHHSFDNGRVKLTLILGDIVDCFEQLLMCGDSTLEAQLRTAYIDAWYLDGFSPKKNAAMWSPQVLNMISLLSKKGTTAATYTSAAPVKSALQQAGFTIKKKKGFGPKRHMTTAVCTTNEPLVLKSRATPWHVAPPIDNKMRSVLIVGAGLAGCFCAHVLAQRGWKVTLIDELKQAGQGGSANQQAVLFPKLSAHESPLTQFMLMAFLYAHQVYKQLQQQGAIGELNGALLLAHNEKERRAQHELQAWLAAYPELGRILDASDASKLTGVVVDKSGLFIPLSGWVDSPALCQLLIAHERISLVTSTVVSELSYTNNLWHINELTAPVVILANGPGLNRFEQTKDLPTKPIRGQMTMIAPTSKSQGLAIPLCGEGHVLPQYNARHMLGATYELGAVSAEATDIDDACNHAKLAQLSAQTNWSNLIVDHWAGLRATTPDYLPLVGPIPKTDEFSRHYSIFKVDAKRWIGEPAPYYPGLYGCAGFGSRGLTTIPLCAEWLAGLINDEISCLPNDMVQSLAPARFIRRNIARGLINSI